MVSKCFTDLFSIDKSRGTPEEEFFQLCKSQVTGLVMHSFQNLLCLLPQGFRVISYERIVGLSTYNFTVKTIKQASGQDTNGGGMRRKCAPALIEKSMVNRAKMARHIVRTSCCGDARGGH